MLIGKKAMGISHNLYRRTGLRLCLNKSQILVLTRCKSETMKYLNVAEKNDAAKNIAAHLSRGTSRRVSFCILYQTALNYKVGIPYEKNVITTHRVLLSSYIKKTALGVYDHLNSSD